MTLLLPPLLLIAVIWMPDTTWHSVLLTQLPWLGVVVFLLQRKRTAPAFRVAMIWAALCGLFYASYLYIGSQEGVPQCGSGGCAIAQTSSYAKLFWGVPTSLVGVFGYTAILLSLLLPGNTGRSLGAFLATFGVGVSAFLTFSSVFVLETTCQWCLGSAAAMSALFVLAWWRMWALYQNHSGLKT